MQKSFSKIIAALAALVLVLPAAATAQTTPKAKVRVASVVSAAWLPLWVAKDKGLFDAHGLDVEITTVQNVSTVVGALEQPFDAVGSTLR
jgi:ABC-type nitrate/sulfonate/bicarbonate transport system substrate-binding protein